MSDFRVPYLVGNKFRRDHQLWPTKTRAELVGSGGSDAERAIDLLYPVGVDLDTIQVMVLRVSEWRMNEASFSSHTPAFDVPVVTQDDVAEVNDGGSTPAFTFKIQRYPIGSNTPRDVTDEKDFLAEWRDLSLPTDFRNPGHVALWETLRNLGVSQGFSNGIDNENAPATANPEDILSSYDFTEPYNHTKFGESGSGIGGKMVWEMFANYVMFDPDTGLFYPPMSFGFGGARLPFLRASRPGPIYYLTSNDPVITPTEPDVVVGHLTIDFASAGPEPISIPISVFRGQGDEPIPPGVVLTPTSGTFDLSLSATKFHKNLNSLGEQVWDENDGHQLHDPNA